MVAMVDECGPVASADGLCVGDIILTINGDNAANDRLPTGPVKMRIVRHNCESPTHRARPHAYPSSTHTHARLACAPSIAHVVSPARSAKAVATPTVATAEVMLGGLVTTL